MHSLTVVLIQKLNQILFKNEKDESINLRATSWPNKTHSNFLLFMGLYSKLRVKAGRGRGGRGGQITRGNSYTYLKETVP